MTYATGKLVKDVSKNQTVAAVVERSMDKLERLVDDKKLLRTKFRRGVRKARIYGNELNRKSYWSIKAQYQRYGRLRSKGSTKGSPRDRRVRTSTKPRGRVSKKDIADLVGGINPGNVSARGKSSTYRHI